MRRLSAGLVLLLALGAPAPARGGAPKNVPGLIPDDRRMEWRPGVPGGIPTYPVFASVRAAAYGAKGDGLADDTAAIQRALGECPAGRAVLCPAGTYRLTAGLVIPSGVALRGEGPAKTRLVNEATSGNAIALGGYDVEIVTRLVRGGERGSTTLEVADASRLVVGDLLLVDQLNDPAFVSIEGEGGTCRWAGREDGRRALGQLVQLVRKERNTLTVERPLALAFPAERSPEVVRTSDRVARRAGVEDLALETTRRRTDTSASIKLWNAIHCWVRNVESSRGWFDGHVTLKKCLGCEVRDGYYHHAHAYGSGHGYAVLVTAQSTDTLVENNACYHLNTGPQTACCGPGNVIAYNFVHRTWGRDFPRTDWVHAGLSHHAAHTVLALFEGNQAGSVAFDFYWGSSSHNTLFRNAIDLDNPGLDGRPMRRNVVAVRLDRFNRHVNALGNVLGHEGLEGELESEGRSDFVTPLIWSLGHPGDPEVKATLRRHGNFDWITRRTHWDPAIATRDLPASLYLTAKPAFLGKTPWPPIGPDQKPMVASLPARERFLAIPAAHREAQDLLYLGEFHLAAGAREEARRALRRVLEDYGSGPFAAQARRDLEGLR